MYHLDYPQGWTRRLISLYETWSAEGEITHEELAEVRQARKTFGEPRLALHTDRSGIDPQEGPDPYSSLNQHME